MSLLTDTNIRYLMSTKGSSKLEIDPFIIDNLTPVGYDLSVGNICSSSRNILNDNVSKSGFIKISPGETMLIMSYEKISMPRNHTISALIMSKVSIVAKALSNISTTIDADWSGRLLISVTNLSREKIQLKYKQPFCTVVFFSNKEPSKVNSGHSDKRPDLLISQFAKTSIKTRKLKIVKTSLLLSIIPIFFIIGICI